MSIKFYTVDIGHGLCQVIRFGDRGILIDGGGAVGKRVAEDFLKRYIKVIVAYVATHNDADHVAAAPELLEHYPTAATLNNIWLLIDRPARRPGQTDEDVIPLLAYAKRREEQGTIGRRYPLYVYDHPDDRPTLIHREPSEGVELQLLFPKLFDATNAFLRGQPNAAATNESSAILRLVVDSCRHPAAVLITGDANCRSFQVARETYKFDLRSRVLSVPHHGGEIPSPAGAPNWRTVVDWVTPEIAVVSAGFGTVPQSTTTKRSTFDALRQVGITTCCTQITKHCHPRFDSFHPTVRPVGRPVPQMSGRKDFPDAVGCAGTITIEVAANGEVSMTGRHSHQVAIDQKVVPNPGCPHCR